MMSFEVIEKYLRGKSDQQNGGEDGLVITDHFVAVIDGMTSKTGHKFDGKTVGEMARDLCVQAVQSLPKDADLSAVCAHLTDSIGNSYKRIETGLYNRAEADPLLRFGAMVGVFSVFHRQIWLIGDTQLRINGKFYENAKAVDIEPSDTRARILQERIASGDMSEADIASHDPGRDAIMPLLKTAYQAQNNANHPMGYAVVDGFGIPTALVKVIDIPDIADEFILATDGYPELEGTLAESEARLQWLIENDPYCYKHYKSTKGLKRGNVSFDDRAYIRVRLGS